MSIQNDYQRVTKERPCPVCGKPDWCLVSRDDPADPAQVICPRVESGRRWGDAGWLHRLRDDDDWQRSRTRQRTLHIANPPATRPEMVVLAEHYRTAVVDGDLQRLACELGISMQSLHRLRIGWAGFAWSFPMSDATGAVRGIRLRKWNGTKLAVNGSHDGLFIPTDLTRCDQLVVCEGPTDTAVLLDLGFDAVGRPSCMGGARLTVALVRLLCVAEAVIVADHDPPGQRGANALASVLLPFVPAVRIIAPPVGGKDARAWKQLGATRADFLHAIQSAAPPVSTRASKASASWMTTASYLSTGTRRPARPAMARS